MKSATALPVFLLLIKLSDISAQESWKPVLVGFEEQKDINLVSMNCIFQCSDKRIWIGAESGVYMYDGYRLLRWFGQTVSARVNAICEDKNKDLIFFMEGSPPRQIRVPVKDKFNPNFKGEPCEGCHEEEFVRRSRETAVELGLRNKLRVKKEDFICALEYNNPIGRKGIYVGTKNGLLYYDADKKKDTLIKKYEILDLMEDASGAVWVLSNEKLWINRWRQNPSIQAYQYRMDEDAGDRQNSVREIALLPNGKLIILLEWGDLADWDGKSGSKPKTLRLTHPLPAKKKYNALAILPDGSILVGGRQVLYRVKPYQMGVSDIIWESKLPDADIVSLKPFNDDASRGLYLGAVFRHGLYRYSKFKFEPLPSESAETDSLLRYAYHIQPIKGKENLFWISTRYNGLFKVEVKDRVRIREKYLLEGEQKNIVTAYFDSDTTAWIGLFGGGLLYYDFLQNRVIREFSRSTPETPLPGDIIYSIWGYDKHLIVYTDKGLCLLKDKESTIWFGIPDGLPHNDGNGDCFYSDGSTGYFGTIGGLVRIEGSTLLDQNNRRYEAPEDSNRIVQIQRKGSEINLFFPSKTDFRFPAANKFKVVFEGDTLYADGGVPYTFSVKGDTVIFNTYKFQSGEWKSQGSIMSVREKNLFENTYVQRAIILVVLVVLSLIIWLLYNSNKRVQTQKHTQKASDIFLTAILKNYRPNTENAIKVIREVLSEVGLNQPILTIAFHISRTRKINIPFYIDGDDMIKGEIIEMGNTLEALVFDGKEIIVMKLRKAMYHPYCEVLDKRYPEKSQSLAFFPLQNDKKTYAALLIYFREQTRLTEKQLIALRMATKHLPSMIEGPNYNPADKFLIRLTNEGGDAACHFDPSTIRPQHFYPVYQFFYSNSKRRDDLDEKLHLYYNNGSENLYWDNHPINRSLKSLTYREPTLKSVPLGAIWLVCCALFERFGKHLNNPFLSLYESYWKGIKDPNNLNQPEIHLWQNSDFRGNGISEKQVLIRIYDFANALFFEDAPPFMSNIRESDCRFDNQNGLQITLATKDAQKLKEHYESFKKAPPLEDQMDGHISGRALYWLWATIPSEKLRIHFPKKDNMLIVHFRLI